MSMRTLIAIMGVALLFLSTRNGGTRYWRNRRRLEQSRMKWLTRDVHINMSDGRMQPHVDPHLRATYTLKCMLARGFTTVRDVVSVSLEH